MRIVVIVVISLILLYLLITYLMFVLVSKKSKLVRLPMAKGIAKSLEPYKELREKGINWVEDKIGKNQVEDLFINSNDDLKLHGLFIEHKNSKGIVIESHGYRSHTKRDLYPSCHVYFNMGYSLLLIDSRTSYKSEGKYITFGIKESEDIISWIKFINHKYPDKSLILAGISMGASSSLMALKYVKKKMNVKCAIVDSGYVSPYEEVLHCIKHYFHLNGKLFIGMIDLWCKIFAKYSLKQDDTISSLKNGRIPILFIHGLEDDFIPIDNTKRNYEEYKGPKKMELFEKATHGISYLVDPKRYIKCIKDFVKD